LKQRIVRDASLCLLEGGSIIGVVLAGAASAQEPALPSTYFFPDSNAAMAVAFLDPNISNETKREPAQLLEARRWPVEYQDPKTKLIWLYRPGMPPMLEGVRLPNADAKEQNPQTAAHVAVQAWHELGFVRDLSRNNE